MHGGNIMETMRGPFPNNKSVNMEIYDVSDFELKQEHIIKTYIDFKKIWEGHHAIEYTDFNDFEMPKCYLGRGSYPLRLNSWEVKTNALLYDTFIVDSNTFSQIVIGIPFIDFNDENEILKYYSDQVDFDASNFLMKLYKNGSIKLVNSTGIYCDMVNSNEYKKLTADNKLYTKQKEIEEISKKAALFPSDELNVPGLLHMMNEDILVSYLTNSSIITREYAYYIKRKLDEYATSRAKYDIVDLLLDYEVPNFACLNFNEINSIRNLNSLTNFRKKLEKSAGCVTENKFEITDIVQGFRDELWEIALNNISDSPSKVLVESLISNVPILSALISAKNLINVKNFNSGWGYTILKMKKYNNKLPILNVRERL